MSAVIGVGQETINGLNIPEAAKTSMNNVIPVMYAVTYVFGTAGSAWIIAFIGPRLMGGFAKCRQDCIEEEARMGETLVDQPGYSSSLREVSVAIKLRMNGSAQGKRFLNLRLICLGRDTACLLTGLGITVR